MTSDSAHTAQPAASRPASLHASLPASPPAISQRRNGLMLGAASLLLLGAVGFAITRGNQHAAPAAAGVTAAPAGNGIAALEARVAANPDDVDAWTRLGEARFDQENYAGAAQAYAKASTIAPGVAGIWSALGEAQVMASPTAGPAMPAAALAAFRRAHSLDTTDPRARYFLAVKKDIDNDHQGAITDWFGLLADTPPGAPWEADLRRTIEQVGQRHGIAVGPRLAAVRQRAIAPSQLPVVAQAIPGPTRDQMQAAAALPKGQQDMMVQTMVDSLAAKLRDDPRQPDRWLMLMRSRMTLGQAAQAGQALQSAIAANPADAARLRAQARLLGVPGA